MIGTVCNGIAAIVMCTFGTVEMLDPFEGAAVLYYGIPTESLGGSAPEQQQFIKHCLAVIGSLSVLQWGQGQLAAAAEPRTGTSHPSQGADTAGRTRRRE